MFKRFRKMMEKYGSLAAYLLVKCETQQLTKEDVEVAKNGRWRVGCDGKSTLVDVISGCLEEEPDVIFLALEGLNAIVFDLGLDFASYMNELGMALEEEDGS